MTTTAQASPSQPSPAEALPRWDTSNIYSSLDGDDYRAAVSKLETLLSDFEQFADANQIRRRAELSAGDESWIAVLEEAVDRLNAWSLLAGTLQSFVYCFVTTDSYNTLAAKELSRLDLLGTRGQKLSVRLQGWIGSLAPQLDDAIAQRSKLAAAAFFLRHAARQSKYLMSEELEDLAADLVLDSGAAWGKLQGNVTSQLKVTLERDGKPQHVADHGGAKSVLRPRPRRARERLSGRAGRLGVDPHDRGCLLERREGHGVDPGQASRPRERA